MPNYGDLQNEIYLAGLSGVVPSLPVSFAELERRAELAMPSGTWSYVAGGAGDEHTQRSNRTAFDHWGLVPRMLRARTERNMSVDLFSIALPSPVFLSRRSTARHRGSSSSTAPPTRRSPPASWHGPSSPAIAGSWSPWTPG